jgi:hypothetical protein
VIAWLLRRFGLWRLALCEASNQQVMTDQTDPETHTIDCWGCHRGDVPTRHDPDPHINLWRFIEEHPV